MSTDDLKDFIESFSGDKHLAVEEHLGEGYVRLRTAEAERRQAKHDIRCVEDLVIEMLRNARDAHAKNIFLASNRNGTERTMALIDDGDGIPADMQELVFEPRVTSKLETMVMDTWGVHGRGMALYSIKSNVPFVTVASSIPNQGTAFQVRIDLESLPEKTDQSTMPAIERDESGEWVVSTGPHNVLRTVVEFALDAKGTLNVYFGSAAEIAASLIEAGKEELSRRGLLFCNDIAEIPLLLRPAAAGDAQELQAACEDLGLEISERTAHRVLMGEIKPVAPILDSLAKHGPRVSPAESPDIYSDARGLKLSAEDMRDFSKSLQEAFRDIAQKYYIEAVEDPIIRVGKDTITVKFPFEKEL